MKKQTVIACLIVSAMILPGCKSKVETSSNRKVVRKNTKSAKTQKDDEEADDSSTTEEKQSADAQITLDPEEAALVPSHTAEVLILRMSEWNVPYSYGLYDETLCPVDDVISGLMTLDNGDIFEVSYVNCIEPEDAGIRFDHELENCHIHGEVDKTIKEDDATPRLCVMWGHYQADDSSQPIPDCYVFIQFEQEYLYMYVRGENQIPKLRRIMNEIEVELPS